MYVHIIYLHNKGMCLIYYKVSNTHVYIYNKYLILTNKEDLFNLTFHLNAAVNLQLFQIFSRH